MTMKINAGAASRLRTREMIKASHKILFITVTAMFLTAQAKAVLYWGRLYDPNLQRWIQRDPIAEQGGINLHQFVANNPINYVDALGLSLFGPGHDMIWGEGGTAAGAMAAQEAQELTEEALAMQRQTELPLTPARSGNQGPTSGVLCNNGNQFQLLSGRSGPAQNVPRGTPGFDAYTRTHVEGHAVALMREKGMDQATLYINNPVICPNCSRNLPTMLPPGGSLTVILPDGTPVMFTGK